VTHFVVLSNTQENIKEGSIDNFSLGLNTFVTMGAKTGLDIIIMLPSLGNGTLSDTLMSIFHMDTHYIIQGFTQIEYNNFNIFRWYPSIRA
jgi:hypothetical protein